MNDILVNPAVVRKVYNSADTSGKKALQSLFGEDFFNQKITDQVKTFEDACRLLGQECNEPCLQSGSKDEIAYKKLKVIIQALNEGWKPDWSDDNQQKFWPWFQYGGSGFSFNNVVDVYTRSSLGSRLCFKSRELAEYAAKQFSGLYNDFLL